MTNLFYIHSPLTEKVARAVSERVKGTCAVVSHERYSSEWAQCGIEEIYSLEKFRFNVTKNWGRIWEGDRMVSALTDGEFHLYTPQTAITSVRLLLSHRLCAGFSVMEEGLMSYCTREQINAVMPPKKAAIPRRIGHLNRLGVRNFCRDTYSVLYVVQEEAFPGRANKEVVPIEFGKENIEYSFKDGECIIVFESMKFYEKKECCIYLESLVMVLIEINRRYESVHFKMHPDNYGKWQETVLRSLVEQFGPPAKEIEQSKNLEDVAISAGVDVVLNVSSAGLYCGLFSDATVYTFHDIFLSNCPESDVVDGRVSGISDWIPEIFWDNTKSFMEDA